MADAAADGSAGMSAMFGAPVGIGAAEKDLREVVQGGLQAQKTLGEIEAQPAQRTLVEAHARYYNAGAGVKEEEAKQAAILERLFQASKGAEAQGETMTVGDKAKVGKRPSAAEPLERFLKMAEGKVNPLALVKHAKTAAEIRQKEAAEASSQSRAELNQLQAHAERAEQIGGMANSALMNPASYDQVRMAMAEAGMPANYLPQSFAEAAPMLKNMVWQSMKAKDAIKLKQQEAELKVKIPLWKANTAKASAGVKLAQARERLATQTYDFKKKYEGENSAGALEAKRSMAQRREALTFKEMELEYPQAPLDKSNWKNNQKYRIGNKFFIARSQGGVAGVGGTMGGELVSEVPAAYRKLADRVPQGEEGGDDEPDDESGEE